MELTAHYMVITGLLIIAGLYLEKWQPPMKKQYMALILFLLGGSLAWIYLQNPAYGILIAGLVFYKRELVEEVKEITESFKDIKDDIQEI